MTETLFCQLPVLFHVLQQHMRLLIAAAPCDEQSMFVPAITVHTFIYTFLRNSSWQMGMAMLYLRELKMSLYLCKRFVLHLLCSVGLNWNKYTKTTTNICQMLVCLSVYTSNITAAECIVTSIIKLCDEESQEARIKDVLNSKFFFLH